MPTAIDIFIFIAVEFHTLKQITTRARSLHSLQLQPRTAQPRTALQHACAARQFVRQGRGIDGAALACQQVDALQQTADVNALGQGLQHTLRSNGKLGLRTGNLLLTQS